MPLLLRLHTLTGIVVGPFLVVVALSGAAYALSTPLERVVDKHELTAPSTHAPLPLADQVAAATAYAGESDVVAVRPAPSPGDTTRVMLAGEGLGESESRGIFVDPGSGEIRGDLTVYGTSGALPLRTWIDQLHRNLHLGEAGRLYSEFAASWLGVVAVAGANVTALRAALDWTAPAVDTALDGTGSGSGAGEHAGHGAGMSSTGMGDMAGMDRGEDSPALYDRVLAAARQAGIDSSQVEIRPSDSPGTAWVVQEIHRSYPTQVDAVAIGLFLPMIGLGLLAFLVVDQAAARLPRGAR